MKSIFTEEQKIKMTENAINMYAFTVGQKVIWLEGRYDHYFIKNGYRDNGIKFYTIVNPLGAESDRVRESEIIAAD